MLSKIHDCVGWRADKMAMALRHRQWVPEITVKEVENEGNWGKIEIASYGNDNDLMGKRI